MVALRADDGDLTLHLEAPLNAAASRALRRLEDDESLAMTATSAVALRFPLAQWNRVGHLPGKGADTEELDYWAARHEALAILFGQQTQQVHVDVQGYIGGADCRLVIVVDGHVVQAGTTLTTSSGVVLPAVAVAAELVGQRADVWTRDAQVVLLAELKEHLDGAAELTAGASGALVVTYHPHLSGFHIRRVARAALAWRPAKLAPKLLSLDLDEQHADGSRSPMDLAGLSPDGPLIANSARDFLLLSKDIAAAATVAKKQRNVLPANIEPDPSVLLPGGFEYTDLELSEYSPRVLGFAPILKPERDVDLVSNIEWYQRDSDLSVPKLRLQIAAADGTVFHALVPGEQLAPLLVAARAAEAAGKTIEVDGQHIAPTAAFMRHIEDHVALMARGTPASAPGLALPDDASSRSTPRKREAAVIAEATATMATPATGLVPVEPVPWDTLTAALSPGLELKAHQRDGIAWLWRHYRLGLGGVLLADEMGLGKTLQLACFLFLQARCGVVAHRDLPSLVACPVILLENWRIELARYFRPDAAPAVTSATAELMRSGGAGLIGRQQGPAIILMAYDTLARHQKELLRVNWGTVVLDESQNVKNPSTYRATAVRGLKRAFGICSTGTPVENRLRDLWTQFDFLSPGRPFQSADHFLREYEKNADGPTLLRSALTYPSETSPVLRREKSGTLTDLPALETEVHLVPMTANQQQLERRVTSPGRSVLGVLGDLQKLYQHPALLRASGTAELSEDDAVAESPKLRKCLELLELISARQEKALVFTLWSGMQDLLREIVTHRFGLPGVRIVNGASNQAGKSQRHLDEFSRQRGFGVLIMSPLAAGAGLNVTAANHVIHYGRWWNPAKEDQATARAHRIGQRHLVRQHFLVLHHPDDSASGFDVKLHELVNRKRQMAHDFLAPQDNEADLEALLNANGVGVGS